jgi:hypothetical protein
MKYDASYSNISVQSVVSPFQGDEKPALIFPIPRFFERVRGPIRRENEATNLAMGGNPSGDNSVQAQRNKIAECVLPGHEWRDPRMYLLVAVLSYAAKYAAHEFTADVSR